MTVFDGTDRVETAIVREIVYDHGRTLLYIDPHYHIISTTENGKKINVGDRIKYQPYGVNFGWLVI